MNGATRVAKDAGLTMQVAAAAWTSWIVPESLWMPITRTIGRIETVPMLAGRGAASAHDDTLARMLGCNARQMAIQRIATGHASRLWGLREYLRPKQNPPIEVVGLEHVEHALARETGAILWVGRFTWASLITKMGLSRAGCAVTHLSRPTHGFGTSPFAIRRLNQIWTRVEERFLRERLAMQPGLEAAALRALRRRLAENRVVSITVGDEGVRTVAVPFFGGTLRMATGPTSLAAASGAPLLPVFTVQKAGGGFRTEIEPALAVPDCAGRVECEAQVAESYAHRLEPWVRRYPGQWLAQMVGHAGAKSESGEYTPVQTEAAS
jgi:lauroyl/myristoyl acyltransferase